MEMSRSEDGAEIVVKMTVGEAVALRDQLARFFESPKSRELKEGLDMLIPGRLVPVAGRKGKNR